MERKRLLYQDLIAELVKNFWKELEIKDEYLIYDEKGNGFIPNRDQLTKEEVLPFFTTYYIAARDIEDNNTGANSEECHSQHQRIHLSKDLFTDDFMRRHFPPIVKEDVVKDNM